MSRRNLFPYIFYTKRKNDNSGTASSGAYRARALVSQRVTAGRNGTRNRANTRVVVMSKASKPIGSVPITFAQTRNHKIHMESQRLYRNIHNITYMKHTEKLLTQLFELLKYAELQREKEREKERRRREEEICTRDTSYRTRKHTHTYTHCSFVATFTLYLLAACLVRAT